jgi:signal transduction histidine kinase
MSTETSSIQGLAPRGRDDAAISVASPCRHWRKTVTSRTFWVLLTLLGAITILHYLTPQVRVMPAALDAFSNRHAVERILFLLPVAGTTLFLGTAEGWWALALAVVIMLPRVVWISPSRIDALVETAATAIVGAFVIRVIGNQERERALRQRAATELDAVTAVTSMVTQSLDLERILDSALDKALEVTGLQAGLIFYLDPLAQELILAAHRGVSDESVAELDRLQLGEGFCGRAAQSGELMVVEDSSSDPRLTRFAVRREGLRAQVIAPMNYMGAVQGVLAISARHSRRFQPRDLNLISAIANQIGAAIENVRLYENLRFYTHEITRVQENERKRIARELHDETIQVLVALSRRLDLLTTLPEGLPKEALRHLELSQQQIADSLVAMRRFVQDLRPPALDHLGLVPALEGLVADLIEQHGIRAGLRVTGPVQRLMSEDAELLLFRIAQEALNNVRRHSGAGHVWVALDFLPGRIRMAIRDDGRGFAAPERVSDLVSSGRLGLVGMHERAHTLGGTVTIDSKPAAGTRVMVDVPIRPAVNAAPAGTDA